MKNKKFSEFDLQHIELKRDWVLIELTHDPKSDNNFITGFDGLDKLKVGSIVNISCEELCPPEGEKKKFLHNYKIDDLVFFFNQVGTKLNIKDKEYYLLCIGDIIGRINETKNAK